MYFVKMGIVNVVIVVRKKKNIFVLLIIMILIMTIFMIIFSINHKKVDNMVLLPNFVGKDISEVKDFVSQNEIELNIEEEYSKTVEENKVVSQSVKEGTNIEEVKTISVVISKGKIKLETYRENGINEIGNIPVMMYHGIHNLKNSDTSYTGGNVDKDGYQRTSEAFRNDLEMYYQKGYRMIRLTDYIDGKIDVEFGKSPIVITFDDGLENNVKVTGLDEKGNIIIDPNSAVGILEEFKKKYPDYNITATFFVNSSLFNQPEYNDKILSWLIDNGYDIGNHSMNHPDFTKIDTIKTQEEIGGLYKILEDKIPSKYINVVALPFGSPYKKSHNNFNYIVEGNTNGYKYQTKATLRVGWEADYSPFDINFDSLLIKRIRAYDNDGKEFDIKMNFDLLESRKYISDGDVNTIVIPNDRKNNLNNEKNLEVITY